MLSAVKTYEAQGMLSTTLSVNRTVTKSLNSLHIDKSQGTNTSDKKSQNIMSPQKINSYILMAANDGDLEENSRQKFK